MWQVESHDEPESVEGLNTNVPYLFNNVIAYRDPVVIHARPHRAMQDL